MGNATLLPEAHCAVLTGMVVTVSPSAVPHVASTFLVGAAGSRLTPLARATTALEGLTTTLALVLAKLSSTPSGTPTTVNVNSWVSFASPSPTGVVYLIGSPATYPVRGTTPVTETAVMGLSPIFQSMLASTPPVHSAVS